MVIYNRTEVSISQTCIIITYKLFEHSDLLWNPSQNSTMVLQHHTQCTYFFLTGDKQEVCRRLESGEGDLFLMPNRYYQQIQSACPHQVLASQLVRGNTYVLVSPVKK